MSEPSILDEATRPRRAKSDSRDGTATAAGRLGQRTLASVHQHLRTELARILDVIEEVAANRVTADQARELINRTAMRQNHWTLGAFCAAYCRVVSVHHTIEDEALFPSLRQADGSLGPVLDRLGAEHEVIAGMLDALDRALVDFVGDRLDVDGVRAAARRLSAMMLSHLAYEEEELLGPIGEFSIMV